MAPVQPIFLSTWCTAASAGAVLTGTRTLSYRQPRLSLPDVHAPSASGKMPEHQLVLPLQVSMPLLIYVNGILQEPQLVRASSPRPKYGEQFAPHDPHALHVLGERLGLAARAGRTITYAELAKGLSIQLPNQSSAAHQLSDILGQTSTQSKAIIDEYLFVLTGDSYREARLLANALLDSGRNQPAPAFFEGAAKLGVRVPKETNRRLDMWTMALARVFDWFKRLPPIERNS